MSWKRILVGATSLWLGLVICAEAYDAFASTPETEQTVTPPSIDSIRQLAELTVLEVEGSEIVTTDIRGHTGGTTAIVLVHGTVSIGVDMEQARFVEVDLERQHAVLTLSLPVVRQVAVDHRTSRVLSCRREGLWGLAVGSALEDKAIASAFITGEQRIGQAAERSNSIQRAMRQAEAVLQRFVSDLGFTLRVEWDK